MKKFLWLAIIWLQSWRKNLCKLFQHWTRFCLYCDKIVKSINNFENWNFSIIIPICSPTSKSHIFLPFIAALTKDYWVSYRLRNFAHGVLVLNKVSSVKKQKERRQKKTFSIQYRKSSPRQTSCFIMNSLFSRKNIGLTSGDDIKV